MEFKALNGLIIAVVEEFCIGIDVPIGWLSNSAVAIFLVVVALGWGTVLFGFFDGTLRPGTGGQVVGRLLRSVLKEIVAHSGELERCSTLEHKDSEVVWDREQSCKVRFALLSDASEGLASMGHFHD